MVFFFIAYLSIIFLFCFPFDIRIVVFMSKSPESSFFSANIGIFRVSPKKLKRKKEEKKRKIKLKIGIKKIAIKKPIDFRLSVYLARPRALRYAEKQLLGIPLDTLGRFLSSNFPSCDIVVADATPQNATASITLKIRFNLFLIISSVMQTIKIGRK